MPDSSHSTTITFIDRNSGDEAAFFVRVFPGMVALSATLKENGDYDLAFSPDEADALAAALTDAAGRSRRTESSD